MGKECKCIKEKGKAMKCIDKKCEYKELNGGDGMSDFYFCKYC